MNNDILNHYRAFGTYTFPGRYLAPLKSELPDNVREIGRLVRASIIHRATLAFGNTEDNAALAFGDMGKVPWWRQPEDDILVTAAAIVAELYRRDSRGLVLDRAPENKLVLTCRYIAITMASILKSKGIPARVRAGSVSYFGDASNSPSGDHWINQYWNDTDERWITVDVDGSLSPNVLKKFDPYDLPAKAFDFAADAWLGIRAGRFDPDHFTNAGGERGLITVMWSLAYDFHCLMNDEIPYIHHTTLSKFDRIQDVPQENLGVFDELAALMQDPDSNFTQLKKLWEKDRRLRLLKGGTLWNSFERGMRS